MPVRCHHLDTHNRLDVCVNICSVCRTAVAPADMILNIGAAGNGVRTRRMRQHLCSTPAAAAVYWAQS